MTCYYPLSAYRTGTGEITFKRNHKNIAQNLTLPCGQCIGCRLERSRQWAIRCMHEASLHEKNCFITLTFDQDNVPDDFSVDVAYFQKFMKRLRKRVKQKVRFYHCGEYGEENHRPHYHACLFGFDFDDKYHWRNSGSGEKLYRSPLLEELWPFGNSEIGNVTFESAAYVARYIMKKQNGKNAEKHYQAIIASTGEIVQRKPEYTTMSRRPGIGAGWYDKYKDEVFPLDRVVVRGREMRPPKFYDNRLAEDDPYLLEQIKFKREIEAKKHLDNCTEERLDVRKRVTEARLKQVPRSL